MTSIRALTGACAAVLASLCGFVAPGATNFPVPIALGSSWDPALVERVKHYAEELVKRLDLA